ncbi:MAG: hypothetical protein GX020_07320 [Firmicutes bacterium]|nr:hypothetical protein [Bacillota bacterium]
MEYLIVLILGFILGLLLLYILRPGLFVAKKEEFTTLEALFDDLMAEMENKHDSMMKELDEKGKELTRIKTDVKSLISESLRSEVSSPKVRAVYDLAGQGLEEGEIARRLELGKGEVQLILQLKEIMKSS